MANRWLTDSYSYPLAIANAMANQWLMLWLIDSYGIAKVWQTGDGRRETGDL